MLLLNIENITFGMIIALAGTGFLTLVGSYYVMQYQTKKNAEQLEKNTEILREALELKANSKDLETMQNDFKEHTTEHKKLDKTIHETAISLKYIEENIKILVANNRQ